MVMIFAFRPLSQTKPGHFCSPRTEKHLCIIYQVHSCNLLSGEHTALQYSNFRTVHQFSQSEKAVAVSPKASFSAFLKQARCKTLFFHTGVLNLAIRYLFVYCRSLSQQWLFTNAFTLFHLRFFRFFSVLPG